MYHNGQYSTDYGQLSFLSRGDYLQSLLLSCLNQTTSTIWKGLLIKERLRTVVFRCIKNIWIIITIFFYRPSVESIINVLLSFKYIGSSNLFFFNPFKLGYVFLGWLICSQSLNVKNILWKANNLSWQNFVLWSHMDLLQWDLWISKSPKFVRQLN